MKIEKLTQEELSTFKPGEQRLYSFVDATAIRNARVRITEFMRYKKPNGIERFETKAEWDSFVLAVRAIPGTETNSNG